MRREPRRDWGEINFRSVPKVDSAEYVRRWSHYKITENKTNKTNSRAPSLSAARLGVAHDRQRARAMMIEILRGWQDRRTFREG